MENEGERGEGDGEIGHGRESGHAGEKMRPYVGKEGAARGCMLYGLNARVCGETKGGECGPEGDPRGGSSEGKGISDGGIPGKVGLPPKLDLVGLSMSRQS